MGFVASSVFFSAALLWAPGTSAAASTRPTKPATSARPDTSEKADKTEAPQPKSEEPDFGHNSQLGLRLGVVGGLRMVFRYSDDTAFCKDPANDPDEKQKFCGHQAPYALEGALSLGLGDSLEPFVWSRLGLSGEPETNTEPVVMLGIGTRLYTMSDSRFKVFFEPAVAWELEGGGNNPAYSQFTYGKDLVFHLGAGFQVELHENVGVFLDAGMTSGVIRSLNSNLEVQVGLQGRTPALF